MTRVMGYILYIVMEVLGNVVKLYINIVFPGEQ